MEERTLSSLMLEHDHPEKDQSAPAHQAEKESKNLAALIEESSFIYHIDGVPFKLRKIDFAESIEKAGIPASIVQTLMEYLHLANSGNEEEQARAELELHENEQLRNGLLVWRDSGLKLGMIDPRICMDGEGPEMESCGLPMPARVTISMIHPFKDEIFKQIIG